MSIEKKMASGGSPEKEPQKTIELQEPAGYKPYNDFPRYTVQAVDGYYVPVGRIYKFSSEEEARGYIKNQQEAGFSGVISLRKEPERNVSDPIEKIDCQDNKE